MESKSKNPTLNNISLADSLIKLIKEQHGLAEVEPRSIFSNYAAHWGTSLTSRGFELLLPIIKFYPITIASTFKARTTKNRILLARSLRYPYYTEKNTLWVSNSQDAFLLTLHQGDIEQWAESMGRRA